MISAMHSVQERAKKSKVQVQVQMNDPLLLDVSQTHNDGLL